MTTSWDLNTVIKSISISIVPKNPYNETENEDDEIVLRLLNFVKKQSIKQENLSWKVSFLEKRLFKTFIY